MLSEPSRNCLGTASHPSPAGRISLTWPSLLAAAAADPERAGAEPPLAWPGTRTSFEGRGTGLPRSRLGGVSDLPCIGPSRLLGEEVLSPPASSPFAGSPFDATLSAFGAAPAGLGLGRFGAASLDALRSRFARLPLLPGGRLAGPLPDHCFAGAAQRSRAGLPSTRSGAAGRSRSAVAAAPKRRPSRTRLLDVVRASSF